MLYSHIIYKLTFPNGKVYIGQTCQKFDSYMNDCKNLSKNKNHLSYNRPLSRAIRKYEWNKVTKEILYTTSQEFVDELETQMIAKYKSANGKFGYNILEIGKSRKGYKCSEKTKNLMSKQRKGKYKKDNSKEKNPMWGKHHSTESIEKIRQGRLGKKHSEESKKKISIATSGKNNPMYGKKRPDVAKRNASNKGKEKNAIR